MTERLQLAIKYKNGNELKQLVNYIHFEDGAIYFTQDEQCHSVIQMPVKVTLANVKEFNLNKVMCDGWKVIE